MSKKIIIILSAIAIISAASIIFLRINSNPTSDYCEQQGGKFELSNHRAFCIFPDGTRIDALEFY